MVFDELIIYIGIMLNRCLILYIQLLPYVEQRKLSVKLRCHTLRLLATDKWLNKRLMVVRRVVDNPYIDEFAFGEFGLGLVEEIIDLSHSACV